MFNVTVLKLRDIVKYICEIVLAILIIISISKFFNKESQEENINKLIQNGIQIVPQNSMTSCLDKTISAISIINDDELTNEKLTNEEENEDILKGILGTQISSIKGIKKQQEDDGSNMDNQNDLEQEEIQLARNRFKNSSYN